MKVIELIALIALFCLSCVLAIALLGMLGKAVESAQQFQQQSEILNVQREAQLHAYMFPDPIVVEIISYPEARSEPHYFVTRPEVR